MRVSRVIDALADTSENIESFRGHDQELYYSEGLSRASRLSVFSRLSRPSQIRLRAPRAVADIIESSLQEFEVY